jgi:glycine/D-amino acid oxidase-like deaminating enzyme
MSPPVDVVQSDTELPERASVVVIGGGIIGVTTALFLTEKGYSVALCEKAASAASNPAATGAGAERWGAISAKSRWRWKASGSGEA